MTASELHAAYWKRVGERHRDEVPEWLEPTLRTYQERVIEQEEFVKTIESDRRAQWGKGRKVTA